MAVNEHFLRLVRDGNSPAASGGARAANALARVCYEHAGRLDAQAADGLHEWIELVRSTPSEAWDVLEGWED